MIEEQAAAGVMSPFVAAGGSIVSSGLNALFQGMHSRRQNKRMVDFWRMNNAYNHPSAQMARLREAGLNPHLMYGGSLSGATGSSGSPPDTYEGEAPQIGNPLAVYQDTKIRNLQADNLRTQNDVMQQDVNKKAAETTKILADSKYLTQIQKERLLKMSSEAQSALMKANFDRMNWQIQGINQEDLPAHRTAFQKGILEKYTQGTQDLSNSQKLGRLRDLEIELKQKNIDFFTSNAIINIATKILGIPQLK